MLILLLILVNFMASLFSILSPNPIVSLLFLVLVFLTFSLLLMLEGMEFLSLLVLLIYVGAICILFVFVLMMLDIRILVLTSSFYTKAIIIGFFVILIVSLISFALGIKTDALYHYNDVNFYLSWPDIFFSGSDIEVLGRSIFTQFTFHFIIISFILLIVMFGSISIVKSTNVEKVSATSNQQLGFIFTKSSTGFSFSKRISH